MGTGIHQTSIKPSLAVVEDDAEFRDEVLLPVLSRSGFDVVGMGSALDLYRTMLSTRYDLVLLDVDLPDDDGFSIARHLRSLSPSLGIVMLTGYGSGRDRMRGLEAGVDAYLSKPADMQELVATLSNLAKRVGSQHAVANAGDGWRLDDRGWRILSPEGVEVGLSLAERQVMAMLATTPGVPVRRDALIERLVENVHDFDPHRLEMLIYRLRRKCLKQTGDDLPLKAVRGVGYTLTW